MPALTIAIPTLGRADVLSRVLARLEGQRVDPDSFEVVVVSDALDPEPSATARALSGRRFGARHLRAKRPGASAARNLGWREAESPLVLFLDDDVLPEPQLVGEHLAWHGRHPGDEVAVLGHVRWASEVKVTPFMRWLEQGIQFDYRSIEGVEAGWGRFYTANVSAKRALVERAGGFDEEEFPFHYEDLDLARRMHDFGLRVLYNRRAVGEHLHAVTLDDYRRRVAGIAPAERRFVRKHPEVAPHFHAIFSEAARAPAPRGRGARLAGVVPRRLPWLGPKVWASADAHYRHALSDPFLASWEADVRRP